MRKNITRYIAMLAVGIMLFGLSKAQAQCAWQVTAVSEPSTCSANGKVTASLSGADAGSVTNVLYRLQSLTSAFNVPQTPVAVFQNIPAGQYKVVASGICNGQADSVSYNIAVAGDYIPLIAQASEQRNTLFECNTGQIVVTATNGTAPYTITITSPPSGYTGPLTFPGSGNVTVLDNLNKGNYTISVKDACNTTASTISVSVTELPEFSASQFNYYAFTPVANDCSKFTALAPYWSAPAAGLANRSVITYSVSYDGGPKSPYVPFDPSHRDTITLPAGQQYQDAYNKIVRYYIKSPCGQEFVYSATIDVPVLNYFVERTCNNNFNLGIIPTSTPICYPATVSVKENSSANPAETKTMSAGESVSFTALPFGTYTMALLNNQGDTLYKKTDLEVSLPVDGPNPYSVSISTYNGEYGNHRAATFYLSKPNSVVPPGTTIELVSPFTYTYFATVASESSYYPITNPQTPEITYFYPGSYKFKVTDGCSHIVYYLDVIVTEDDVYVYNWSYTEELTCTGKKITPTGTCRYNGFDFSVYFQIVEGPAGYSNSIVPNNTPIFLPNSGTYTIGISANSSTVENYKSNVKRFDYSYGPLTANLNSTYGWVCPGLPADSGYIRAAAMGGRKGASSAYTFKLAAAGQGATGPYMAANITGNFSTSASGGAYTLTANQNYEIWMGDDCGASVIQTVKIVDFATAQLAAADKAEYCLGDKVHLSVINLPSSAIIYQWTGPDNFVSALQNPTITPVKPTTGGNYHVTISSDICRQPIEADVNIILAAYVTSCYSAVTDTSVNPYAYGLLGNWRPSKAYTYYSAREQSNPDQQTNIRKDGAFNDFMAFWKKETSGWKPQRDNANWVWNTETTVFNKKGFQLENKDPLGRYNAGIYGYDNAIPVAVIQNSRYSESAFEGFEDYGFGGSQCDDNACPADRRFYLSGSDIRLDSTEKHTGRYSLRVTQGDGDGVALKIPVTATATDPTDPVFNMEDNNCAPFVPVLKSVKATKSILIPPFSLLSDKKILLSAWVKEAQDCKCTAYTGNDIKLVVKGTGGSVAIVAHPSGGIIDGWQRYEQVVDLPPGTDSLSIILQVTGTATVFF